MPFYECEARQGWLVGLNLTALSTQLFGQSLNTPNDHVSDQMYTWVYVERLTVQGNFRMLYSIVFPANNLARSVKNSDFCLNFKLGGS